MFPVKVRLSQTHLRELTSRPDTYVYCKELDRHINIEPSGLSDVKTAIHKTLDSVINKYDKMLRGIFLGYTNLKVLHDRGLVSYDDYLIHIDINADFYVFTPELGCKLTGVVTMVSKSQIGCLVYRVFNASVVNTTEEKDWPGTSIQVGQEIQFEVTVLKMNGPLPYIRGKLSEFLVTTSHKNHDKQSKKVEKSKKKKMSLQNNTDQHTEAKKIKKNKNVDTPGMHSDVNVYDNFAEQTNQMPASDMKKQKKRKKPDDDTNTLKDSYEQRKKCKLEAKRSAKEQELLGETQSDSLCAENNSFLRTLNFDVRNAVTHSKHKKIISSTVLENHVIDRGSSKKNTVMNEIGEMVENSNNGTDFSSPKKKRKKDTHEKLSPLLSFSKEGKRSSVVECNFDVESEMAASQSKKKKKKKEKLDLDESNVVSFSEKEVNLNDVKNFKHASIAILSSTEKKKKREKIELGAYPTSENENILDSGKSFEEENTASLILPTKSKKKKKEKRKSEATNTIQNPELESTSLITNSALLAGKGEMKKVRPVAVADEIINLPVHTSIESNLERGDVGNIVSPTKKKKHKKRVDLIFSSLMSDLECGASTHAEKDHETNGTAMISPTKSSAKNKLVKQEFNVPKDSIFVLSANPPDIILKQKIKHLKPTNVADGKNRHKKVREFEGIEHHSTNELVSDSSTKNKTRRKANADTSGTGDSFQSGADSVPTVSPTPKKHKKRPYLEMLPDVLLPSGLIPSTSSEYNVLEDSETASVVSHTMYKIDKKEKEGLVNVPRSLAKNKVTDVHTKINHSVSPPPSTKSDETIPNLHSSTLESLVAHARSLFKEYADLQQNVTHEKCANDSINKKVIGSKKEARREHKNTKEKITSNIHLGKEATNSIRNGSNAHFTSAAGKKVSNDRSDDKDSNSSSFESDTFVAPTKKKNKERGTKTSKHRVASNLESVELADDTKSFTAAKTNKRKEYLVSQKVSELVESGAEAGAREKPSSKLNARTTSRPKTRTVVAEDVRDTVTTSASQELQREDKQDVGITSLLSSVDNNTRHTSLVNTKSKQHKTKSKTSKQSIQKDLEHLHVAQEGDPAVCKEVGERGRVQRSRSISISAITQPDINHAQLSDEDKPRETSQKKHRPSSRISTSLSPGKHKENSPQKCKLPNQGADKGDLVTDAVSTSLQLSPELLQQPTNAEDEQSEEDILAAIYKTPEYFRSDSMANAEDRRNRKSNRRSLLSLNKPAIPLLAAVQTHEENSSPERLSRHEEIHTSKGHRIEGRGGFVTSDEESTSQHVASSKVDLLKSAKGLQDITSRLLSLIPSFVETLPKNNQKDREAHSDVQKTQIVKSSGKGKESTKQLQVESSRSEKLEQHSVTKKENTKGKKFKSGKQVSDSNSDLNDDKLREQLLKSCLTRFKTH